MSKLASSERDSTAWFTNRQEAGERLAQAIWQEWQRQGLDRQPTPAIVYALPKGGIPIAAPVAHRLDCPLSLIVAKKITRPKNQEFAIGAITADGHVIWSPQPPTIYGSAEQYDQAQKTAQAQAQAQEVALTPYCPYQSAEGAIALVIDDGLATGMTMAVAIQAIRDQHPAQIWLCVPVAPLEMMPTLQAWCDQVIVLETPPPFYSVSRFYQEFPQVELAEAIELLQSLN